MPFGPLFGEFLELLWDTLLALIGDLFLASLRAPSGCAFWDSVWVTFRVSGLAEEMKNPLCQPIELGLWAGNFCQKCENRFRNPIAP